MIKKMIMGTGIVVLLALLFFGWDAVSYVRTSAGYVSDAVKDTVPMEFQIERARRMIEDLDPDIRENLYEIAREQVQVERLEKRIGEAEAKLAKAEEDIRRLTDDLKTGKKVFVYAGGRTFTVDQVQSDLASRFKRFKTATATLDFERRMYETRQRSLDAARQQLDGMLAQKKELQVKVENVQARLKMIAAVQTTSDYNFDDSRLARAKELIDNLSTRLDVEEEYANVEGRLQGQIPLDEPAPDNIVEQVTEFLDRQEPTAEALAQVQD